VRDLHRQWVGHPRVQHTKPHRQECLCYLSFYITYYDSNDLRVVAIS
jgi:hypothetical protein